MNTTLRAALAAFVLLAGTAHVSASSLEMIPVLVDVPAPAAASTITLSNTGSELVNAQVRVFKWSQANGKDQLTPTRDVVASPPAIKIKSGNKSVIRIVRVAKTPVSGEESYRLVVDEVPKPPKAGKTGVGISLRYSLPVFFASAEASPALQWTASVSGGNLRISAANGGGRHVRLADLQIASGGKPLNVAQGLAGYVLGESQRSWTIKGGQKFAGKTITIIAKGDNGPVEATVKVGAGQ